MLSIYILQKNNRIHAIMRLGKKEGGGGGGVAISFGSPASRACSRK